MHLANDFGDYRAMKICIVTGLVARHGANPMVRAVYVARIDVLSFVPAGGVNIVALMPIFET